MEARLGKPSHLLEGDKLKQFLAQVPSPDGQGSAWCMLLCPKAARLPRHALSSLQSGLQTCMHHVTGCLLRCPQSGKVLRFFAVWDDRGGLYGDRRPYRVHYYLEDDTVEINEVCVAAVSVLSRSLTAIHGSRTPQPAAAGRSGWCDPWEAAGT